MRSSTGLESLLLARTSDDTSASSAINSAKARKTSSAATTTTIPPATDAGAADATASSTATGTSRHCASPGKKDQCYKDVIKAMYDIRDNPKDYHGLSVWSSFEEVQDYLHKQKGAKAKKGTKQSGTKQNDTEVFSRPVKLAKGSNKSSKAMRRLKTAKSGKTMQSSCPLSCECQTALAGSPCYEQVMRAMRTDIAQNPKKWRGLDAESSFEDVQAYLWEHSKDTNCARPCRAPWRGSPSLFCWSVVRQYSYEADVVRAQLKAGLGFFLCDGHAILSEEEWTVGKGPGKRIGTVKTVIFEGADVGMSKDWTAANAELFMHAWDAVLSKTPILGFDWAIKVDPDAVVIPDRLRSHLADRTGWLGFVRNCNSQPQSADFPMMFGALEVLSRSALQTYAEGVERCKSELDWYVWGEDFFMGKCLPHLGVPAIDDFSISSDGTCTWVDCFDDWAASFHPFKSAEDWMGCWNTTTGDKGGGYPPLP